MAKNFFKSPFYRIKDFYTPIPQKILTKGKNKEEKTTPREIKIPGNILE
jgi:hypothetical protein